MADARLRRVRISGYRSIGHDGIDLQLPNEKPLVLIGENNAGKSNILRGLDLVLGDFWPGSHRPEDHEFFGRSGNNGAIDIRLDVEGLVNPTNRMPISNIHWRYQETRNSPCSFNASYENGDTCPVNNGIREQLFTVYVGNERDLKYQLSYASKYTALSKLMRSFHKELVRESDRVERLKHFTQSLVSEFEQIDAFDSFRGNLHNFASTLGGNLPFGLQFDFSAYDPSNFFQSLRLLPHLNKEPRTFDEMGTGQGQVLAIAFLWAYAKSFKGADIVLLLEEPEAHLHPLAQEWLANKITEAADSGIQVILTTHSPYFIDLSDPVSLTLVSKSGEDQSTDVMQLSASEVCDHAVALGAPEERVTRTNVGSFYEHSSTSDIKAGLFAPSVLLIEGGTEKYALPILLKTVGLDLLRANISLVSVDGHTNLSKWVRFFTAYGKKVYVILDSDSNKTDQASIGKIHRDLFRSLKLDESKPLTDFVTGSIGVHESFTAFDCDYERAMGDIFGDDYLRFRDMCDARYGASKPVRARFIASGLSGSYHSSDPRWQGINQLASAIRKACSLVDEHSNTDRVNPH